MQLIILIIAIVFIPVLIIYGIWLMTQPWDEIEAVERDMAAEERRKQRVKRKG